MSVRISPGAGVPEKPVLVVGNFLASSVGTNGVCEELASELLRAGWPVLTTSDKIAKVPRLLDMVGTAWRRRHEYAVAQVDVYSGTAFLWAEAVCWVLRRANKPYVLTLHGGGMPAFATRWPTRVRALLESADVVTTPSRFLQQQMTAYRSDLRLQPNPLHVQRYRFRLRHRARPELVWLRSFHGIYAPALAPKVVALLQPELPDVRLAMAGSDRRDGSLRRTRETAEKLGVSSRITFTGRIPKSAVPEYLDKGDVFLNTATVDNTPISILEALASGLCVVSTNVGGIPYLLEDGTNALLVPPDDPESMAAAVRRIITEPGLAEHLSRQAREKAVQFDWSRMLPEWERLLQRVARADQAVTR